MVTKDFIKTRYYETNTINCHCSISVKVNALLPADVFIRVISGLLSNELASVRRKAMELLNNILTQHKTKFTEEEVSDNKYQICIECVTCSLSSK